MTDARRLSDRACLTVGGEGATEFLQNLVTCNVERLSPGEATFGALLTPQGKILFDFLIVRRDDGFLIDVAAERRADLMRRLLFYRLRAPVTIEESDAIVTVRSDGTGVADPRDGALGHRQWGAQDAAPAADGTADWHARRIERGIPECDRDYAPETTFPHEALMDRFALAFDKGCYVGQEVVSRMQHRGTARSRFVAVEGDAFPAMGTPLTRDGRRVGVMGASARQRGLAFCASTRCGPVTRSTAKAWR